MEKPFREAGEVNWKLRCSYRKLLGVLLFAAFVLALPGQTNAQVIEYSDWWALDVIVCDSPSGFCDSNNIEIISVTDLGSDPGALVTPFFIEDQTCLRFDYNKGASFRYQLEVEQSYAGSRFTKLQVEIYDSDSIDITDEGQFPCPGYPRPVVPTPVPTLVLEIQLEEPVDGVVHGGIGNLRGWAISNDGIDRVEIWIDGAFAFEAPYGGSRTDVGAQFPEIDDSELSGFSLAYGYSNLSVGPHTIMARAYTELGEHEDSTSNFTVVAFDKTFIFNNDIVDTTGATITAGGDKIIMENVSIDGRLYDLTLQWRTAEQGFEIIEIR